MFDIFLKNRCLKFILMLEKFFLWSYFKPILKEGAVLNDEG